MVCIGRFSTDFIGEKAASTLVGAFVKKCRPGFSPTRFFAQLVLTVSADSTTPQYSHAMHLNRDNCEANLSVSLAHSSSSPWAVLSIPPADGLLDISLKIISFFKLSS